MEALREDCIEAGFIAGKFNWVSSASSEVEAPAEEEEDVLDGRLLFIRRIRLSRAFSSFRVLWAACLVLAFFESVSF